MLCRNNSVTGVSSSAASDVYRGQMQRRAALLHQYWTMDRAYLPPPMSGKLASVDPALLVTPPKGLEIGYVPIVTQQGRE